MRRQRPAGIDQTAGNQVDGAGIGQTARDDKHQGDNDCCRVAETGECLVLGHDAENERNQQRGEGDKVVTEPAPQQKGEYQAEQRKKDELVVGHSRRRLPNLLVANALA